MSDLDEDFVEVNNQLPYKPIRSISVSSVAYENNKFIIDCQCDIDGKINEAQTIVRTEEDINWLIQNISNNNKTCLLPKIYSQSYISILYDKMTVQPALRIEYEKRLKEKLVERALRLVNTIIFNHLRNIGGNSLHPLFIFYHKNFGLYKNPIYYKEDEASLSKKMGNYIWQKYTLLSGKGVSWSEVQREKVVITAQMRKLQQMQSKLSQYASLLDKLQQQYIAEKQKIKLRLNGVQKLLLTYENEVKYLQIIGEEVQQTLVRIENKTIVEGLMKEYSQHLIQEGEKSIKQSKDLFRLYVEVMCDREERIRVAPH